MALECRQCMSCRCMPYLSCPVFTRRGNARSIGRPRHGGDMTGVTTVGDKSTALVGIPHPYDTIFIGRDDIPAIGRPGPGSDMAAFILISANKRAPEHSIFYCVDRLHIICMRCDIL